MTTAAVVPNDVKAAEGQAENNSGFTLTTTTPPVTEAFDRETVGRLILESIDWDRAEHKTSDRSGQKYATTKAIAFNMSDADDRRYQISISVNRWEAKQAREPLAKGAKNEYYRLGATEIGFLASEIDKAKASGDSERMGKLMTLKLTNQLQGGLDLNGLIEVKNLISAHLEARK